MNILTRPLVTEKMTKKSEELNQYGFIVEKTANKIELKKIIEDMYNVTVTDIRTMRYGGKTKSRYTKTGMVTGKSKAYKKAIVTLIEGDEIDFYSNI